MIDSISELFVFQRRIFMIFLFDEKYRKHIKIKKHEIKFHAQSYLHLKSSLQLPQLKVQTYHFSVHVVVGKKKLNPQRNNKEFIGIFFVVDNFNVKRGDFLQHVNKLKSLKVAKSKDENLIAEVEIVVLTEVVVVIMRVV